MFDFRDQTVILGSKVYTVTFAGSRVVSVYVHIDARWKSCTHKRVVWDTSRPKKSALVERIIAQAKTNFEEVK